MEEVLKFEANEGFKSQIEVFTKKDEFKGIIKLIYYNFKVLLCDFNGHLIKYDPVMQSQNNFLAI